MAVGCSNLKSGCQLVAIHLFSGFFILLQATYHRELEEYSCSCDCYLHSDNDQCVHTVALQKQFSLFDSSPASTSNAASVYFKNKTLHSVALPEAAPPGTVFVRVNSDMTVRCCREGHGGACEHAMDAVSFLAHSGLSVAGSAAPAADGEGDEGPITLEEALKEINLGEKLSKK